MPTQSLRAALLTLGGEGLPWSVASWQALTRIPGEPWSTVDNAPDDSPSLYVPEWTTRVANQVRSFATTVWGMASAAQDAYIAKRDADNDSAGRTAWAAFVSKRSGQWGINRLIDDVLETAGRSPIQILCDFKTPSLPTAEAAQIYDCATPLAQKLFGDEAFLGTSSLLKGEVVKFCRTILSLSWNRYRKAVSRDVRLMDSLYEMVTQSWIGECDHGINHLLSDILVHSVQR
ncbi:hypothetical protein M404DRAFT_171587 [Pisolithus tinctorius Marx 270]|uniref:Uncharacterized protein n=1 Tax=Pisolithus tinctorius Marx 270 TaxID=870435 RepID=A0A0C3I7U6_PISTI|nr:hypothetical protein M404DRAFT_171587 [Pisolithus tinctorius Marx 270]